MAVTRPGDVWTSVVVHKLHDGELLEQRETDIPNKTGGTRAMNEWTEHPGGLLEDAGDVGGDAQAGPAYARQWQRQGDDGLWHVFSVNFYRAEDGGPYIEEQREYTVCSDPDNVGDTEVSADLRYGAYDAGNDGKHSADLDPKSLCLDFEVADIDWEQVMQR